MNLEQLARRGAKARAVLENDVYVESWQALEQRLTDELANADRSDEQARTIRALLIATRKSRVMLERVMQDGAQAAKELEVLNRRKSLRDVFRAA